MRMWMVDPETLCRNHLLGEHNEIHMLVGTLRRGKNIQGYLDRGLLEPSKIKERHDQLVKEMRRRGWTGHKTPIDVTGLDLLAGKVDVQEAYAELMRRCDACRERRLEDTDRIRWYA